MSNEKDLEQKEIDKENHPNTIEYKRLQDEMNKHLNSINATMDRLHFTDEEKKEILDIIEYHAILKEAAKNPLNNIRENMILEQVEKKVKDDILAVSNNMVRVVNEKMKEIIDRKLKK